MMSICWLWDSRSLEFRHTKSKGIVMRAKLICVGLISTLLSLLCSTGCRISKLGKDYPESTNDSAAGDAIVTKSPIIQPQQQADSGASLNVTFDDAGKLKESLTLRLDYFPTPRPDGVSVPTCYTEIAGHLVVGRLICSANGNLAMDVVASQVNQQCYTSTPVRKIAAKSAIVLIGCVGSAVMQTTRYDPDLKLEVTK